MKSNPAAICAAILFLIPSVAFGDALATSICVLPTATAEELIKESGSIQKVTTRQLWDSSLYRGFIGYRARSTVSVGFKSADQELRLLATRLKEGKVLYSIRGATASEKDVLIGAGVILSGQEIKKNTDDEPFVVVLRVGNFLRK